MSIENKFLAIIPFMKYLLIAVTLFFAACSVKNYEVTQSKIFIIKSPNLKFADIGYLKNTDKSVEVELFNAGKAIEKISINHLICTSQGCMSKGGFNKDYLNENYPTSLLQNVLLGSEIYSGKNRVQTREGFEQNIKDENVDIIYKVSQDATVFEDRKNRIIFKIKDTK